MLAVALGHRSIVNQLIKRGADLELSQRQGTTALMFACYGGSVAITQLLINAHARIETADNRGLTAFDYAKLKEHTAVSLLLRTRSRDVSITTPYGDYDDAHAGGTPPHSTPPASPTPRTAEGAVLLPSTLVEAAQCNDVESVRTYLDAGGFVDATEAQLGVPSGTMLILASSAGCLAVMQLLISRRANVDLRDASGCTALGAACVSSQEDAVDCLLGAGAAVNVADHVGLTPLMLASLGGRVSLVRLLLSMGARKELKDDNEQTALMHAQAKGHTAAAMVLTRPRLTPTRPLRRLSPEELRERTRVSDEAAAALLRLQTTLQTTPRLPAGSPNGSTTARPIASASAAFAANPSDTSSATTPAAVSSCMQMRPLAATSLTSLPSTSTCGLRHRHGGTAGRRRKQNRLFTLPAALTAPGQSLAQAVAATTSSAAATSSEDSQGDSDTPTVMASSGGDAATIASAAAIARAESGASISSAATSTSSCEAPHSPASSCESFTSVTSVPGAAGVGAAGVGAAGGGAAGDYSTAGHCQTLLEVSEAVSSASAMVSAAGFSDIPESYCCPITQLLMLDPVVTCDGHSYERVAISEWFARRSTSPLTGAPLNSTKLIANTMARSIIREFAERYPQLPECEELGQRIQHQHGMA